MSQLIMPRTEDAKWRPLYEAVRHAEYGEVFTYEQLAGFVSGDVRGDDRWIIYAVDKELMRNDKRTFVNVRNVGYKIALPEEHKGVVKSRLKRGKRQIRKGIAVGAATDLSRIADPAARQAVVALTDHLRGLEARMGYQEKRLARTEARIDAVREEAADTAAAMESRVARLEELLKKSSLPTDPRPASTEVAEGLKKLRSSEE